MPVYIESQERIEKDDSMTALTILENPTIRQSVKRISVDEYHRLSDAAIITEDTELLHGIIIQQMTKSPLHTWTVRVLVDWLRAALADQYDVRQEQPLTLHDSGPEPDIAIVAGSPADYRTAHPGTAKVVMEVAIATIELDREKALAYAAAGVNEYWLVLPQQRMIEIRTNPSPSGYQEKQAITAPATARLQQFPDVAVDLETLFADVTASGR
jgi:Uma2 family endonuclease